MDIELWMKAVQIDAYYELLRDNGVERGADLPKIGDFELQVYTCTCTCTIQYSVLSEFMLLRLSLPPSLENGGAG